MDLREILREAGIEEKVVKQVLTTMKAEKIYTTSEENADIRLKKSKEKIETLEEDIKEKNTKIDSYKTIEEDKKKISDELETIKKEAADKDYNIALDTVLKEANSKNNKLVKALLDKEKITFKDGKLEGINEQLETIKKENDFLFEKKVKGIPDFGTGGKTPTEPNDESVGTRLGKQRAEQIKESGISKFIK